MSDSAPDRSGVLIVRLWVEANHSAGLRARITQMLDTMGAEQSVAVAASVGDICTVVQEWVEAFVDSTSHNGDGHMTQSDDGCLDQK